jgi:hypothetical protein
VHRTHSALLRNIATTHKLRGWPQTGNRTRRMGPKLGMELGGGARNSKQNSEARPQTGNRTRRRGPTLGIELGGGTPNSEQNSETSPQTENRTGTGTHGVLGLHFLTNCREKGPSGEAKQSITCLTKFYTSLFIFYF